MKIERNILIAFILNLSFSVFEFLGGLFTGSVAIISDAIHDIGDAVSVGISYFFEKKSKKQPDDKYTYGYGRYSVIGSFIMTVILLVGSVVMMCNAITRIIIPSKINYNGMIVFAILGVCVNFCAVLFTHGGDSLNQKTVNLHMLEDVLGWLVVLVGAIVMRFTDFSVIDPIMSIGVSLFVLANAIKNLKAVADIFLEKTPHNVGMTEIKERIGEIDGILDIHHIHLWSLDGQNNFATMHVVTDSDSCIIKEDIRKVLYEYGVGHVTIEIEKSSEHCNEKYCHIEICSRSGCSHHHHSH